MRTTVLSGRALLRLSGKDAETFLQSMITNDLSLIRAPQAALYALLLNPTGKFLFDFFVIRDIDDSLLVEHSEKVTQALMETLCRYKLRSQCTIESVQTFFEVYVAPPGRLEDLNHCQIIYPDSRDPKMWMRGLCFKKISGAFFSHDSTNYHLQRVQSRIPDGDVDLISAHSMPLDYRMDELHAISLTKGCFCGQEVIAKIKYRGKIKRTLYVVEVSDETEGGILPEKRTPLRHPELGLIGEMCGRIGTIGLALCHIPSIERYWELEKTSPTKKGIQGGSLHLLKP